MIQKQRRFVLNSGRWAGLALSVCFAITAGSGCAALGYSSRVLWRVASPDGQLVAVCQERPEFDGPGYNVRLEQQDGGLVRQLYDIGDGDPCSELVWSPDGQTLAVLSGYVARVRFVDVSWAIAHPEVTTAWWSWRQVDLSTERSHLAGFKLQFVGTGAVALQVCSPRPGEFPATCGDDAPIRRFDIPLPIVTGHR